MAASAEGAAPEGLHGNPSGVSLSKETKEEEEAPSHDLHDHHLHHDHHDQGLVPRLHPRVPSKVYL